MGQAFKELTRPLHQIFSCLLLPSAPRLESLGSSGFYTPGGSLPSNASTCSAYICAILSLSITSTPPKFDKTAWHSTTVNRFVILSLFLFRFFLSHSLSYFLHHLQTSSIIVTTTSIKIDNNSVLVSRNLEPDTVFVFCASCCQTITQTTHADHPNILFLYQAECPSKTNRAIPSISSTFHNTTTPLIIPFRLFFQTSRRFLQGQWYYNLRLQCPPYHLHHQHPRSQDPATHTNSTNNKHL